MTKPSPSHSPEGSDRSAYRLTAVALVLSLFSGFVLLERQRFLIYHTAIELAEVALVWSAFFLIWGVRKRLERRAFVLLAGGAFCASLLELLHTMAFEGSDVAGVPGGSDEPNQLWTAAQFLLVITGLAFAVLLKRRVRPLVSLVMVFAIGALLTLSVLHWAVFPTCYAVDGTPTAFELAADAVLTVLTIATSTVLYLRRRLLDPQVHRLLQVMLVASVAAELLFDLSAGVSEVGVVIAHTVRLLSIFAFFLALTRTHRSLVLQALQANQAELAESERRWRNLSESNPDHITELDHELKIQFVNYPSPGLTTDDLLGSSILDFTAEDERSRVSETLRHVLQTGERTRYETEFRSLEGRLIVYETTAVPRVCDDGTPGLTLVSRNITERKTGELLLASHARISQFALTNGVQDVLRKVLDEAEALTGSEVGFFHFVQEDQENVRLQAWSSHTLSTMCRAQGSSQSYPISEAGVWADSIRQARPIIHNDFPNLPGHRKMPAGHAALTRELIVPVLREGRVVAVLGVGNKRTPYDDADVSLINNVADLAWDVVQRKRAELALDESEHRLARTMANLPGMVYRCRNDEHWTMEFVSQGCRDLTGYAPDDLVGNRVTSYNDIIHPDDRDLVQERVFAGLDVRGSFQLVYRLQRNDGELIWVREQGRGVYDGDELLALEGFVYDVSAQIEAQEGQRRLERRALEAQKLESLGVLAGGIAHDFNNLLQSILGYTQLALLEVPDGGRGAEHLENAMAASRRAADLTGQMLAYSGHASIVKRPLNLSNLVDEMVGLLRSSIPRNIELHCDLTHERAVIEAGPAQIQQVVLNLVTNAAEAIEDEAGTVTVTTELVECSENDLARGSETLYPAGDGPGPGPFVRLAVHDTGRGIAEQTLQRLFEPFFTTKFTGRGLGLAAVQGIIRGHAGTLCIDTEPGSTTFEVLLPRLPVAVVEAPAPKVAAPSAPDELAKRRFLVVDDEPSVREFLELVLRREGGESQLASDGFEALELLQETPAPPSAVFLDLTMPRMGGQRCFEQIRQLHPHLPVIIMSGYSADELRRRFPDDGATAFVSKPFERSQILSTLRSLVDGPTPD